MKTRHVNIPLRGQELKDVHKLCNYWEFHPTSVSFFGVYFHALIFQMNELFIIFKPILAHSSILYPLKTSENQRFKLLKWVTFSLFLTP